MEVLAIAAIVLGGIMAIAVIITISAIINGWVLTKLWHWFAVPIFGLDDLTVVQAIGIALVVGFLTHQKKITNKKDGNDETDWVVTTINLLSPFIVLLIGYIVHLFM